MTAVLGLQVKLMTRTTPKHSALSALRTMAHTTLRIMTHTTLRTWPHLADLAGDAVHLAWHQVPAGRGAEHHRSLLQARPTVQCGPKNFATACMHWLLAGVLEYCHAFLSRSRSAGGAAPQLSLNLGYQADQACPRCQARVWLGMQSSPVLSKLHPEDVPHRFRHTVTGCQTHLVVLQCPGLTTVVHAGSVTTSSPPPQGMLHPIALQDVLPSAELS